MQNTVETAMVRRWLENAQADGLDPQRIYSAAVKFRLPQWSPIPATIRII